MIKVLSKCFSPNDSLPKKYFLYNDVLRRGKRKVIKPGLAYPSKVWVMGWVGETWLILVNLK
jgi:hypothetical protein